MKPREAVANRLIELCDKKNITLNHLATISALPPSSLKNTIYGVSKNPGIVTIKILCDVLYISLAEFFNTLQQEIE